MFSFSRIDTDACRVGCVRADELGMTGKANEVAGQAKGKAEEVKGKL